MGRALDVDAVRAAFGTKAIVQFRGAHAALSNMHRTSFTFRGRVCASAEHAYQAFKSSDQADQNSVFAAPTPKTAKARGKRVTATAGFFEGHEARVALMREVISAKFARNSPMATKLIDTGDHPLVEGSTWGDRFWGATVRQGVAAGDNWLGRLLEERRDALRQAAE